MQTVYTIGYEGASLPGLIGTLKQIGIQHVLDIRQLPQSRRPGFSKNALAKALAEAGIEYSHQRQLGDPKAGREAARRGDMDEFKAIFEAHMDLPASHNALLLASEIAESKVTVLLCYERDPKICHRSLVISRLVALGLFCVRHLGVVEIAGIHRADGAATAGRHP